MLKKLRKILVMLVLILLCSKWNHTEAQSCGTAQIVKLNHSSIVIDGHIDTAWLRVQPNSILPPATIGTAQPDYAAQWRAMWDSGYLYILTEVKDNTINLDSAFGSDPHNFWHYDAVEVFIDGKNTKLSNIYDSNDVQYGFSHPTGGLIDSTDITLGRSGGPTTAGIKYAILNVPGGYNVEIKIPWNTLGIIPGLSNNIGFNVAIDDNDYTASPPRNSLGSFARNAQVEWHDSATLVTSCDSLENILTNYQKNIFNAYTPHYDTGGCDTTYLKINEGGWFDEPRFPLGPWMSGGIIQMPKADTAYLHAAVITHSINYVDTLCLNNNFSFESRFRFPTDSENLARFVSYGFPDSIYGSEFHEFHFDSLNLTVWLATNYFNPGAPDSIYLYVLGYKADNSTIFANHRNISTGLKDLSSWVDMKVNITNGVVNTYINGALLDTLQYSTPFSKFYELAYDPYGYDMQTDWWKMYDSTGRLRYFEDFNGCDSFGKQSLPQMTNNSCSAGCQQLFANYFNAVKGTSYPFSTIDSLYYVTCSIHPDPCDTTTRNFDIYTNPGKFGTTSLVDCNPFSGDSLTVSDSSAQQIMSSIYMAYDSLKYLTFDVKYTYTSDTVYHTSTNDALVGSYTMAGKKALYNLGNIEFMQNDSFFIAVYNDQKFILVSDPLTVNTGSTLPFRTLMDSIVQSYSVHYTISNTLLNDSIGQIQFTKADSIARYDNFSITYFNTNQKLLRSISYAFEQPVWPDSTGTSDPSDTTLYPSDTTVQPLLSHRTFQVQFSNYRFDNYSQALYDENRYIWNDNGVWKPIDKYKGYKIYYSRTGIISSQ